MELGRAAIYVMSCDNTADVAGHLVESFIRYWPDCSLPIYFGVNQKTELPRKIGACALPSKKADWRAETIEQLTGIRKVSPETTHLLVFLDDFILSRQVNDEQVTRTAYEAARKGVQYLRLRRLEEAFIVKLAQRFRSSLTIGGQPCMVIRKDHPYYFSLQVAVWNINYLIECVQKSESIWSFERMTGKVPHYSVLSSLVRYKHVVEKGQWDYGAKYHCEKHAGRFQPGNRPFRIGAIGFVDGVLRRGAFWVFGYSLMRWKSAAKWLWAAGKRHHPST